MAELYTALLLLLGLSSSTYAAGPRQLKLVTEWRAIDFNFPSERLRSDAIARKDFTPGNAVPIDVDVHYKGLKHTQSDKLGWNSIYFYSFCLPRPTPCSTRS